MIQLIDLAPFMLTLKNIDAFSSSVDLCKIKSPTFISNKGNSYHAFEKCEDVKKYLIPKPSIITKSSSSSTIFKQKRVEDYLTEEVEQVKVEQLKVEQVKVEQVKVEQVKVRKEYANKKDFANKREIPVKNKDEIVPRHRDKLFWCFYIIYKGEHEYEQHLNDNFITEKNFKIATAEKLKGLKDKFKQAKLKISEIEDEMINKQKISLKGLHALCIVYGKSILYEYKQKYCEFLYNVEKEEDIDIIILKEKDGDYAIKCFAEDLLSQEADNGKKEEDKTTYIKHIREKYWQIENVDKGLKTPSAYSLKELQEIGEKFAISLKNALGKNKTKQVLYEEILTKM